jgi:hypothetical protein
LLHVWFDIILFNIYILLLQGTLLIVGAIYFNVMMCGALFRPVSFYTKQDNVNKTKYEKQKLLDQQETEQHFKKEKELEPAEDNHQAVTNALTCDSDKVRYRSTSEGSLVMGSIDSLHAIAVEVEPQSKSKGSNSSKNKCVQFLAGLLDFSVLGNCVVNLFVLVSFLLFFGYFNFILFMPPTAESRGVAKYDSAYLVSITGICDLFGRILVGVAGDLQFIARYKIMGIVTLLCGVAILGFNLAQSYWVMAVFVGCYGFLGGCYVSINAPTLIDLVGLKLMPKVLGVVLFIQGLGAAVGQPLLGRYFVK